jgi:hypothetical protein
MRKRVRSSALKLLVLATFALILHTPDARATLGEKDDSVEADRKVFVAARRASVPRQSYTVHEIASEGITIREYAAPDGTVYGLAWNGLVHPDLSSIMGSYFADFKNASQRAIKVRGRRPMSVVQGSKVIVEKSGHMRGSRGRAYVPSLVPAGVNTDEIQ